MFKNRVYIGVAILLLGALISGCGEYEKILKSRDFPLKYDKALAYYEEDEFVKAGSLFDQISNIYRGTTKADTVKYYQAKSYYGQTDYVMAGHYFSELATTYPNSVFLEESEFMTAYCYYKQSPRPELDQDNTFRAIQSLRMYMVRYPNTERMQECKDLIAEMSDKLVEKSYISAKLYYDLGYFKSAIIALRNSLADYPDTKYREDVLFLILKSSFLLADNSVYSKQMERYQATVDEYYSFVGEFPESQYVKEAERIYTSTLKILEDKTN